MTITPPGRPTGLRTSARDLLRGTLLLAMSKKDAATAVVERLPWDLAPSGLVLTGKLDLGLVDDLRKTHPELTIACEPDADSEHFASVAEPFLLPPENLFGPVTLGRVLDDQIEAGASFALTPTGHLRAGDTDAAKAVIDQANELDREDVVVRLPFDATVMRTDPQQIAAIARRSRHTVALSLAHDQDPMTGRGVVDAMRALTLGVPDLILWRTDLAAFAHLVDGGLSAGVGFVPSLRHGLAPGKGGKRINRADRTPHVLLDEHLRYMRTSEMQRRFASTEPPHCSSIPCDGAALDRFTGSDADRLAAHEHNAVTLLAMAAELRRVKPEERARWWHARLTRAVNAHEESTRETSQHWPLPPVLAAWAKLHGVAA